MLTQFFFVVGFSIKQIGTLSDGRHQLRLCFMPGFQFGSAISAIRSLHELASPRPLATTVENFLLPREPASDYRSLRE